MQKSILVTGGTGMLGAHLLLELCRQGHSPMASFREGSSLALTKRIFALYGDDKNLWKRVHWQQADLEDSHSVYSLLEGVQELYHCAAMVSFDPLDGPALLEINPLMTANLVNAGLETGLQKMMHVSSVAAMGRSRNGKVITEHSQWSENGENSIYARSKYRSELEVWRGIAEGLKAAIVNPGIILGPGDWNNGSAKLFQSVAEGFKFYTEGINGFVDVRDVVKAMILLMRSEITAERYLLVAENCSYHHLFDLIAENLSVPKPSVLAKPWMGELVWRYERIKSFLTGKKPLVTPETARTAHQTSRYSNQKIEEELDFSFRPLEESIADIAALYRQSH